MTSDYCSVAFSLRVAHQGLNHILKSYNHLGLYQKSVSLLHIIIRMSHSKISSEDMKGWISYCSKINFTTSMNCSVAFFEWLHIRVSSSDLKVQCTLYIIIDMIACQNIAQWLLFEWSHASKGCIHIYFSKLVQLTFRRFKEVSAVHKEVSRLVRIHPTAVAELPEALQVTRSSQQDIEIIPWKVRTNDFYSQVTMH